MDSRVWKAWLAAFVTITILDGVVNGVLLAYIYADVHVWRADMGSFMWLFYVVTIVGTFLFALFYSIVNRGGAGISGWSYGLLIGIWLGIGKGFATYGMVDIPLSLAMQWFAYEVIEYVIAGIIIARMFKPKA